MQIVPLAIPEVVAITPRKFGDNRGYFSEVYNRDALAEAGIAIDWVQDNQSLSAQVGTVRGLHFQAPPTAQDKLVRVLRGAIFDVAVDIRDGSSTYGKWVGAELSEDNWTQLLVPAGFAHGFMTMRPETVVMYKVSAPYSQSDEGAIKWDDPDLAIAWPDTGALPVLSDKDAEAPGFAKFKTPFTYRD